MSQPAEAQGKSLRGKFVRLLLIVSSLMALATTAIVVLMSAQASAEHFAAVQGHIQDGIISKGKVLTQNHALALRGLALDNAFLDKLSNQTDDLRRITRLEFLRESGSEGIELIMWLIMRGALGEKVEELHRFYHVPASNTAVGHIVLRPAG